MRYVKPTTYFQLDDYTSKLKKIIEENPESFLAYSRLLLLQDRSIQYQMIARQVDTKR